MNKDKSVKYLKDYQAPKFQLANVYLQFEIEKDYTIVSSRIEIKKNDLDEKNLELDGINLELIEIKINDNVINDYKITDNKCIIYNVPEEFIFECKNKIFPSKNTSLEGLYQSNNLHVTQCEAEGFRKITYFLDRPDVMSKYKIKIISDIKNNPVLLSNGNKIEEGQLDNNKHYVIWEDPFPKPCYLFALVAGNLEYIQDHFITCSNRRIELKIFVEKKDIDKCDLAMQALKKSMRWDEQYYGREYDLDLFMIVAVDMFNMGAMENKGLNIFNSSCILSNPQTATDRSSQFIEAVIAHEYFHNWTGNRITCRDWFQLSLKEGLTVFRDQEFSATEWSHSSCRIKDVKYLKLHQFTEDQSPVSHPVQPQSYIDIDNFYTVTIYEKGAELIRMLKNITGEKGFRKGTDLYFDRHDGQAVTIEEFVKSIEDANNIDLKQFRKWYITAGTPKLEVTDHYNAEDRTYIVNIKQDKELFIPINTAIISKTGTIIEEKKLFLTKNEENFQFDNINEKPILSILRDFSAPVLLNYNYSKDDLRILSLHDNNEYNRWNAIQELMIDSIMNQNNIDDLVKILKITILDQNLDNTIKADMINLPDIAYLGTLGKYFDIEKIYHNRKQHKVEIANQLEDLFLQLYQDNKVKNYIFDKENVGKRDIKNISLNYLCSTKKPQYFQLALQQFNESDNLTDQNVAFDILVNSNDFTLSDYAIETFYDKWKNNSNVINNWFATQANAEDKNTLKNIKKLLNHPKFNINNPNNVRSLVGSFANNNYINFHNKEGYEFLADFIIKMDDINAHVAARLLTPFTKYKRYQDDLQNDMQIALKNIANKENLSSNCFEIISKLINI